MTAALDLVWSTEIGVPFHEAGHAVAALVVGWPVTGASLVPDEHSAGRVYLGGDHHTWARTPDWVPLSIISAAGMAASATARIQWLGGAQLTGRERGRVTREGGHGSHPGYDMPNLRWYARGVWRSATGVDDWMFNGQPANLGPAFDPAWRGSPDGVYQVGAFAWRRAVELVTSHWGAVTTVAELLSARRYRHVSDDEIRSAVAGASVAVADPGLVGTGFWPAEHSRLVWRPHGMCRST